MSAKDRNPRLGRGLAALLGDAARPDPAIEHAVRLLPIAALRPGPFQARMSFAPDAMEGLAESIRASGILQPILVRPERDEAEGWQIIAGERRWRAASLAGLHEVPCLVRRLGDAEAMAASLIENLQRQDLNAIEEAEGYRRLAAEFGLRQDEVGQAVGRSRAHVANTLRLLNLPQTVQGEVRTGALSAGHARALLGHPDPQRAALQVIARGLSVRQTEALVQARSGRGARAATPKDSDTAALERQITEHLGLKIAIEHRERGGTVRIDYTDLDQLDSLVSLLLQRR
jgi:ParB family chromosome partitioning protein